MILPSLTPKRPERHITTVRHRSPWVASCDYEFGVSVRCLDAETARHLGLPDRGVRMVDAAWRLATLDGYRRLAVWTHTYGFRGHFATHSPALLPDPHRSTGRPS